MHAISTPSMLTLFDLQQLCGTFRPSLPLGGAMHWAGKGIDFTYCKMDNVFYEKSLWVWLFLGAPWSRDHEVYKHARGRSFMAIGTSDLVGLTCVWIQSKNERCFVKILPFKYWFFPIGHAHLLIADLKVKCRDNHDLWHAGPHDSIWNSLF